MFETIDTEMDRRINLQEFMAGAPKLASWGLAIAAGNEAAVFRQIDQNGGGQVLFIEFCEWAIEHKLNLGEDDDDGPPPMPAQVSAPPAAGTRDLSFLGGGAGGGLGHGPRGTDYNTLDWAAIHKKLPYEKTPEAKAQRRKLWRAIDMNGNGYASLAEIDRGIQDVLRVEEIFNAKPAIMRAFKAAKNYGGRDQKGTHGYDYVQWREFRVLLQFLRHYFELWVMFETIDTEFDRRINLQEFTAAAPRLSSWGLVIAQGNEAATFRQIDRNGGGQVLFIEFCEWAIVHKLDLGEDDNDGPPPVPGQPDPPPAAGTRDLFVGGGPSGGLGHGPRGIDYNTLDWAAIHKKLPYEKTPEAKAQRRKLWQGFDINGNGYLSLAEIDKGIRDILEVDEIFNAKPAIMRAYKAAKNFGHNAQKGT